jgi:uncharacterized protein (TIGR02996 family)
MTDGEALRAAIVAEPEDDTLRLIYADWLEENSRPERAAFVRAQVWAAQAEPYSPEALKHNRLADRVSLAQRTEWAKTVSSRVSEWRFSRGFVEHVAIHAASFPRNAASVFAVEPIRSVQVVRFAFGNASPEEVTLRPFFEVPELARVTRLDFRQVHLSEAGDFDPLTECRHLGNLTDLCLRETPVPPGWLGTMLVGPAFPALAGLDLTDVSHLGPRLADMLPRADHRRFRRLDVSRVVFTSDQIQRALAARCLREVEELRLGWMLGSGREGALTHLDLGWVIPRNRLRLLDLNGQGIGDEGVKEFVKELPRRREPLPLRWLGLAHNRIGADGVRALVRSDEAKLKLYYLDVRGNGLTLSQKAALQSRFPDAVVESRDF